MCKFSVGKGFVRSDLYKLNQSPFLLLGSDLWPVRFVLGP